MPPKIKRPGDVVGQRARPRGTWVALGASAVVIVAAVVLCDGQPAENTQTTAAPSAEAVPAASSHPGAGALLGGLAPGDSIGAWRVHVLRVVDRQLGVDLLHGDKLLTVWIAKKGSRPAKAPRETERYSLYYGYPLESQEAAARDIEAILNEIEARVRRSEQTASPPSGM